MHAARELVHKRRLLQPAVDVWLVSLTGEAQPSITSHTLPPSVQLQVDQQRHGDSPLHEESHVWSSLHWSCDALELPLDELSSS